MSDAIVCRAPAVEVWRLVHDPSRLHEWMADTERVEPGEGDTVVRFLHGWPDHPMPTRVRSAAGGRVTISCLVSDIDFAIGLSPHPQGCEVTVTGTIPEAEAARCAAVRELVGASLRRLAERAAAPPAPLG
ncbi:MAG: SRPBCC family protein [Thermoleophilia bacterium]